MTQNPAIFMTIAGSDSSAGAGIQADLKTAAHFGVFATSVIANITAQNTCDVRQTHAVPPQVLRAQFEAVWQDFKVSVIKIGLLGTVALVQELAALLKELGDDKPFVILDPVMVASSGARFVENDTLGAMTSDLMPLCDLITPNIKEAEALLSGQIKTRGEMEEAAKNLVREGLCRTALITGGEGVAEGACDVLYDGKEISWYEAERILAHSTHGTGCTLSSAIACGLAKGEDIENAIVQAKKYVSTCIAEASSFKIGHGSGPLFHGFIK